MSESKTNKTILDLILARCPSYFENSGNPTAYLIAVNQPTINEDILILKNWGFTAFKRTIGCCDGELENVYLIVTDENHYKTVNFLIANNQDYAIFLDNQRTAYKILPDKAYGAENNMNPEVLGWLHEVSEAYIHNQKSWTYDILTGTYFVIY